MGRRSVHTSEELRELIISETTALIQDSGFSSLSAREIARRIEYSPGTIYNVFENLDDLVVTIEGRFLDRLDEELARVARESKSQGRARLLDLLVAYLSFAKANEQFWRLVNEHRLAADANLPAWYHEKVKAVQRRIEEGLASALGDEFAGHDVEKSAFGLWIMAHGIANLTACSKFNLLSPEAARNLLLDIANTYVDGIVLQKRH